MMVLAVDAIVTFGFRGGIDGRWALGDIEALRGREILFACILGIS